MHSRKLILAGLALFFLCQGLPAAPPQPGKPLRFYRVLVPAENKKLLAQAGYFPIARKKFAEYLRTLGGSENRKLPQSQVAEATYEAKFQDGAFTAGRAALRITKLQPQGLGLVDFSGCSFAILHPVWRDRQQPADLGLANNNRQVLVVPGGGTLEFAFTQRARRLNNGDYQLDLQVPQASVTKLRLEMPASMRIVSSAGIQAAPTTLSGGQSVKTEILLGGHSRVRLRLTQRSAADERPSVELRQTSVYRFDLPGLTFQSDLRLTVRENPLRQFQFLVQRPLKITQVRLGADTLPFRTRRIGNKERVIVDFTAPLMNVSRTIRVLGIARIVTGKKWKLPVIQPQQTSWQQATTELVVARHLDLADLDVVGAHQSQVQRSDAGESRQFQLYGPQASLEVRLVRHRGHLVHASGTTIDLQPKSMRATFVSDLTSSGPELFKAGLLFPANWEIDQVTTDPPDALEEFSQTALPNLNRLLQVSFRYPVAVDRSIRVTVTARRRFPPKSRVAESTRHLRVFDVQGGRGEYTACLNAAISSEVTLLNDDVVPKVAVADLSPEEQGRLTLVPHSRVYRLSPQTDSVRYFWRTGQQQFTAHIDVFAEREESNIVEEYRIRVRPTSLAIPELAVHLSAKRLGPVEWTLAGGKGKRLPAIRRGAGAAGVGEDWLIQLQPAKSEAFEIVGRRVTAAKGRVVVATPSLPEASTQDGSLFMYATAPHRWQIQGEMRPASIGVEATQRRHLLGGFRYDPSLNQAMSYVPVGETQLGSLCVWDYDLRTRLAGDSSVQNTLRLRLENTGEPRLDLALPSEVAVRGIRVDNMERPTESLASLANGRLNLSIPLDNRRRFSVVELEYAQPARMAVNAYSQIAVALATTNVPIMHRNWLVSYPAGYQLYGGQQRSPHWLHHFQRRFFGGLVHSGGLASVAGRKTAATRAATRQMARRLAANLRSETTVEWGRWFLQTQNGDQAESESFRLWIDAQQMRAVGITRQTPLPTQTLITDPQENMAKLLRRVNLVLIGTDDGVVLTGRSVMRGHPACRAIDGSDVIFSTTATKAQVCRGRQLDVAESWNMRPGLMRVPWTLHQQADYVSLAENGWRTEEVTLTVEDGVVISYVAVGLGDQQTYRGLALLFFVLGLGVTWIVSERRRKADVILPLTCGLVVCFSTAFIAPLFACAFWGACLATVGFVVRRQWQRAPQPTEESASLIWNLSPVVVLLAAGLASMVIAGSLQAQDPLATKDKRVKKKDGAKKSKPAQTLFRVLDPVGKDGKPSGGYLHVPRAFYNTLVKRADRSDGNAIDWLVGQASYRCNLAANQRDIAELTATYQLYVFRDQSQVAIPFSAGALPLIRSARLDGETVGVRWQSNSSNLLVDVFKTGTYTLQVSLGIRRTAQRSPGLTMLPIPPVAQSELRIATDLPAAKIQVRGNGLQSYDANTREIRCDLGSVPQLHIEWAGARSGTSNSLPLADQLIWLTVKPQSVTARVKVNLKSLAANTKQIRLRTPSNMRLISRSWTGDAQPQAKGDGWQEVIVPVTPDQVRSGTVALEARFLLTDTNGIGIVSVPKIEVLDSQPMRQLVGLTVDPLLQVETLGEVSSVTASQFLRAWGDANSPVQLTFRQPPAGMQRFSLKYRQPVIKAKQRLSVTYQRHSSSLDYRADVETSDGSCFQHRIAMPPRMRVSEVVVRQGDESMALSRFRNAGGILTLFLPRDMRGKYTLQLMGKLSHSLGRVAAIPRLSITGVSLENDEIHLFRHAHAKLNLVERGVRGYTRFQPDGDEIKTANAKHVASMRRLVGSQSNSYVAPRVVVTANRSRAEAMTIIRVNRDAENWKAIVDHRVKVTQGLLDVIRLEIPASWVGPFTISPQMSHEVRPIPDSTRRVLLLKPDLPASTTVPFRVRITGRISQAGTAPNVVPLDVSRDRRYVLLPKQGQSQRFGWNTVGLRRIIWSRELTRELSSMVTDHRDLVGYQVVGSSFQATVKQVRLDTRNALVRLVDHFVQINADGSFSGMSVFDIEPSGQSSAKLSMPEDTRLAFVRVAGLRGRLEPDSSGHWDLQFGSRQLPQRIEVGYTGQLPNVPRPRRSFEFDCPQIKNVDVEHTSWTICGPRWSSTVRGGLPGTTIERQESVRLDACSTILDIPSDVVSQERIGPWAQRWIERFAVSRRRLSQIRMTHPITEQFDEARTLALEEQQRRNAARLGVRDVHERVTSQLEIASTSQQRWWQVHEAGDRATLRQLTAGARPRITLRFGGTQTDSLWIRAANVSFFLTLACCGFVVVGMGRRLVHSGFGPRWLGISIGILITCFISPWYVGFAIILLATLIPWRDPVLAPNGG